MLDPKLELLDPAEILDRVRIAVNDYLAAQNWAGYKDGDYGHDEGCREVRQHLGHVIYVLNEAAKTERDDEHFFAGWPLIDFGPTRKFHIMAPLGDERLTVCGADLRMHLPKPRGCFRIDQVEHADICKRCLSSEQGEDRE